MEARHYFIRGRVQGVGYRYFTLRTARALGVSGWVRNLPDRRVEVFAQGDPLKLDNLEQSLRDGPAYSRVDDIEVSRTDPDESTTVFEIVY